MPFKTFLILFISVITLQCAAASSAPLRNHYSPYLAMHADDAVKWRLWDEGILAQAKHENKLIFLSSGFFSCHWCHVMQRESFQHEVIAGLLNNNFIPVMVDRELNPDLDAHLFEFVEKTRGVAGWPMNVFLTPQGHPLLGSGYLPPDEFLALLKKLHVRWENEGEGLARLAEEGAQEVADKTPSQAEWSRQELVSVMPQQLLTQLIERADLLEGGLGEGSKFPKAPLLEALFTLPRDVELDGYLQLTLSAMAYRSLRDQIGGGFFRYTVDPGWEHPHFEKMLYDNAQLAALYLDAADRWQSVEWRRLGLDTLDAVLRDFSHSDGGYVASLSALDGADVEGGYYLWRQEEIEALLPVPQLRLFHLGWRLLEQEAWQGGLPLRVMGDVKLATTLNMPLSEVESHIREIRQRLYSKRATRQLPRDEKRLAGWNGLVLSALARGVRASPEGEYKGAGSALRDYLMASWDGEQLWRVQGPDGKGRVAATLEDYALVAQGMLDWAVAVNDPEARRLAVRLTGEAFYRHFHDGQWSASSGQSSAVPAKALLADDAIPSAAAVIARLGRRFGPTSPLLPRQLYAILFADPISLQQAPLDYPSYVAELQQLAGRASRLSLDQDLE